MKKTILVVAAHPDDEVLGCGGTIAKLASEGCRVYTLILGEGVTSRDNKRSVTKRKSSIIGLKKEALAANRILGVTEVFSYNLPDNRFDTVPLLDVVKVIENVKSKIKPDMIFTHYYADLNLDHRVTYEAVITASRPLPSETVKDIYSFEILSSTEWRYPNTFSADTFFDISTTLKRKIEAMKKYRSELKAYPHPRSLRGIELNAECWGMKSGLRHAEAFKVVRSIR